MPKPSNTKIIRALAAEPAATWADSIPLQSQADFEDFGRTIMSDEYEAHYNAFLDQLVNKIALTLVRKAIITDKLAFWRSEEFNLGDHIEEIFVGLSNSYTFDAVGTPDQFEKFKPKVDAMFHRRTVKDFYPITIQYEDMRAAFRRPNGLADVVEAAVSAPERKRSLNSYIYNKQMFMQYRYLAPASKPMQPTQFVRAPRPVDDASGAMYSKIVKKVLRALTYPRTEFNAAGEMLQSRPENIRMYINYRFTPSLEVDLLSRAFTASEITSKQPSPIVEVDGFGEPFGGIEGSNDDVLGVVADLNAFKVYNNLFTTRTAENARGLYRNYFLHVWDLHAVSYYTNVVYIIEDPDATDADFDEGQPAPTP